MSNVLILIFPIFAIIWIGYILTRLGLIEKLTLSGMSFTVIYIFIPSAIFCQISSVDIGDLIVPDYMFLYAMGGLSVQVFAYVLFFKILGGQLTNTAMNMLGSSIPNSILIGYPLVNQMFDANMNSALVMSLIVESILIMPLALFMAEIGRARSEMHGKKQIHFMVSIFGNMFRNPIILSIVSGLSVSAMKLEIPAAISQSLSILSGAGLPLSLIVIGGSLVGIPFKENLRDSVLIAILKLLLQPSITAISLVLFVDLDYRLKQTAVIFSAMPMFSVFPVIGGGYGLRSECSSSLMVTTIVSFFTLPLILYVVLYYG